MSKEEEVVIGPARVVDPAAWLGYALLFVAFVVDFGIAGYLGLPIPNAVGGWAWGFGMVLVAPKLVSWANRRRWRIIPVSLRVKVEGVPTIKMRVIRAEEDKKKPQAKE